MFVDDDEASELMDRVVAAAEANRSRRCERPVLRGEPAPGRADGDLLALLDRSGPLGPCLAAIGGADDLDAALADPAVHGHRLAEAAGACEPLDDLLGAAVAHGDACSPFLPGRRGQGDLRPLVTVMRAAAVRAHSLREQPRQAIELLLDALRAGQDFSRGGPSLIEPMMAVLGAHILLPSLNRLLSSPGLDPDDLSAIDGQLAILAASHPHPSSFFEQYMIDLPLYWSLPALRDPDWEPPGGFPFDRGPRQPDQSPADYLDLDFDASASQARQGAVLTIAARRAERAPDPRRHPGAHHRHPEGPVHGEDGEIRPPSGLA